MAKPFEAPFLRGYATAIIFAHAPGPHMWPSQGPGPDSKWIHVARLSVIRRRLNQ